MQQMNVSLTTNLTKRFLELNNMNEYTVALTYIVLGLIGGAWHYAKKRYIDKTTTLTFIQYLQSDIGFTLTAMGAIVGAELTLASTAGVHFPHLNELIGAITTGYMADSHLNKCNSNEKDTKTDSN